MVDFITRIELYDEIDIEIAALDRAMAAAGFSTIMRGHSSIFYKMPTATYFSQATGISSEQVRDIALVAVRNVSRAYDIVTVSGDIAYFLHPAP